ncbi:MAG: hypothetical protein V1909_00210 [Candidatus Micrarchaeota archaeon]
MSSPSTKQTRRSAGIEHPKVFNEKGKPDVLADKFHTKIPEKITFKSIGELPQRKYEILFSKYKILIDDFLKSGLGIVSLDVSEQDSGYVVNRVNDAIRKLGYSNKIWTTCRNKRAYIINIEKTGISRSCNVTRRTVIRGSNRRVKVSDILDEVKYK